ncbi:MAG: nucleotide exchange factor GrpE [Gemmatimonadetes bacterium]|nr:nucleotide exchange factor GrpE [Gemmatimonadota bacterium]
MARKRHEASERNVGEEGTIAPGRGGAPAAGGDSPAEPDAEAELATRPVVETPGEQVEEGMQGQTAATEFGADEADHLQSELQALTDRHVRLAAEFDNYRKRSERERSETWSRAQADLVRRMLDVLDDLERVTSHDPGATSAEVLLEGVGLVQRKLARMLEDLGLVAFDPTDQPFDPATMEAVLVAAPNDGEAEDTVAQVFQKGYTFKEQLVRPARVVVRKHG